MTATINPFFNQRNERPRSVQSLAAAIESLPPPPCSTCSQAQRCALSELACSDFDSYCNEGLVTQGPRAPTRAIYLAVFCLEDSPAKSAALVAA